ncbi:MAG TPA: protein translocase subunit SecD, partial [Vicinamibacterales bacterium]|nr:protein translocase subunit SecD [Vicinamibacterales bacterium]
MYKNLRWKLLVILGVTGLAIWSFTPPSRKISLGLDLQGGVHFLLAVQTDEALKLETTTASEQLRQALKDKGITVTTTPNLTDFGVTGVARESDQQFRSIADTVVGTSFTREASGNGTYVFRMKPNVVVQTRQDTVTQSVQTIERRVNELGVSEPIVAPYGTSGDQIIVQLPGLKDVARAQEIIGNPAQLELKIVESGPAPDQASLLQSYNGQVPADLEVVSGASAAGSTAESFYLVRKVAGVTGRDLRNARPTVDQYNTPAVSFTLNSEGAAKFGRLTRENINRQLAIILDHHVQSAPVIESAIDAEGRITGRFTQQEAQDLALVLRSGALPASLTYVEQREVGPTLGADSVRDGVLASLIGLAAVTVFMLLYYRLSGINAFV